MGSHSKQLSLCQLTAPGNHGGFVLHGVPLQKMKIGCHLLKVISRAGSEKVQSEPFLLYKENSNHLTFQTLLILLEHCPLGQNLIILLLVLQIN